MTERKTVRGGLPGTTYFGCLREMRSRLEAAGIPDPETDARLLLGHVTGWTQAQIFLHGEEPVPGDRLERLTSLTEQRERRIPLQHITGTVWFMGLPFAVDRRVLIPRQDTEILAETVLEWQKAGRIAPLQPSLLDMCTGSGCLAVSLSKLGKFGRVTAADLSADALEAARENGDRNGCGEIEWTESDLFASLPGRRFDVIVSNPPYIPTGEIPSLQPEVQDHDPFMALDGREDGLFFYRELAAQCPAHLTPGGWIFFEIGQDQGAAVSGMLERAGFSGIRIRKDDAGKDRVVCGCISGK